MHREHFHPGPTVPKHFTLVHVHFGLHLQALLDLASRMHFKLVCVCVHLPPRRGAEDTVQKLVSSSTTRLPRIDLRPPGLLVNNIAPCHLAGPEHDFSFCPASVPFDATRVRPAPQWVVLHCALTQKLRDCGLGSTSGQGALIIPPDLITTKVSGQYLLLSLFLLILMCVCSMSLRAARENVRSCTVTLYLIPMRQGILLIPWASNLQVPSISHLSPGLLPSQALACGMCLWPHLILC